MIFSHNSKESERKAKTELQTLRIENSVQTVAFIDIVGSTALKLREGHQRGIKRILTAVTLAKSIVKEFGGTVVKELGDGVLCRFENPEKSCLAVLAIKAAGLRHGVQFTTGATLGLIDLVTLGDQPVDILGATVDRCARIQSFALPNQVLVDKPLMEAVKTYLLDYNNIAISAGRKRILKGIGESELFEISTVDAGLRDYIQTSFRIHEEGRLPIADKIYFVRDAKLEVIEFGAGLTTISQWFSGQRPSEFRDYIENLLVRGVRVIFLLLDPKWSGTKQYLQDRGELNYLNDIKRALKGILEERERLLSFALPGEFRIVLYRSIPTMHILCVDPQDATYGRMLASPYLYGLNRSESPVLELSRQSNPELFRKYSLSLQKLTREKGEPYG